MKLTIKSLLFTAVLSVAIFGLADSVLALSAGGIGGRPAITDPGLHYTTSWFVYNLSPGESKKDTIQIINSSDEERTAKLYPVDSTATGDGDFTLKAETAPRESIGGWVVIEEELVTVAAHSEKNIEFTITIPEDASAGEHSGGIIVEGAARPASETGGQANALIKTRIGIRIYETVPGEVVKKLELDNFDVTRTVVEGKEPVYKIDLSVANQSNVSVNTDVVVHVSGWGKTHYFIKSEPGQGFVIDPNDVVEFFKGEEFNKHWLLLRDRVVGTRWEWPEPKFGHFTFQAVVSYEGLDGPENFVTPAIDIWVIPWLEIINIGVIVLLLLIILTIMMLGTSTRRWQEYTVKHGDQLASLAAQANINWKKLVKANKLKHPLVNPGQKIHLPSVFFKNIDPKKEVAEEKAIEEKVKAELGRAPAKAKKTKPKQKKKPQK